MLEVVGHRVLIEPKHFETELEEGALKGFKLDVGTEWKRDRAATVVGTILSIGPNAWKDFGDGKPWAKVGDVVYYAKYSGKTIEEDDKLYIICNDEDVQAIVTQKETK